MFTYRLLGTIRWKRRQDGAACQRPSCSSAVLMTHKYRVGVPVVADVGCVRFCIAVSGISQLLIIYISTQPTIMIVAVVSAFSFIVFFLHIARQRL